MIYDNGFEGIDLSSAHNNNITDNTVYRNDGYGIELSTSNNNHIIGNTIDNNNEDGINLDSSSSNTFTSNNVSNNSDGIRLSFSSNDNQFTYNNVYANNDDGIDLSLSNSSTVTNNNIYSNIDEGLRLLDSNNITITDNNIYTNNEDGIHLDSSNNNTLTGNNVTLNNHFGINLSSSSSNLIFNNYFDNTNNAYDDGTNIWNNTKTSGTNIIGGPYLGGNYWSDYTGVDIDGDGIGDTNIPHGPGDYLPLTTASIITDINQSVFNRGFPIRHALDGDWAAAQSFIPTVNYLTNSEIYLRKFGTPEFDLTVELRSDHPQGTLIDTIVFTQEVILDNWQWLNLDFADIAMSPSTEYFIVIQSAPSGVTTSFGYEWGYAFGNQYNDGSFWFTRDGGGLWRDLPTMYEFMFRTYGYS